MAPSRRSKELAAVQPGSVSSSEGLFVACSGERAYPDLLAPGPLAVVEIFRRSDGGRTLAVLHALE
jgi:hypothetical protein